MISSSHHTYGNDGESGFALVELVVAMAISIVVLFGILLTLDSFSSNASRQTRVTDANDQVRKVMDRIVSDLRQAATIDVAQDDNLIYTVIDSATQTRRERICLASGQLWRTSATSPISLTGACPTAGSDSSRIASLASSNTTTNPIFRYDSATAADVRSVGLTFALNAGAAGRPHTSTLRASTFVRAKSETALPVGPGDIATSCSSTARPTLTLSSSVGSYSVSYTDIDGSQSSKVAAGVGVQLPIATASTTVVANVTSSSGLISRVLKLIECPT